MNRNLLLLINFLLFSLALQGQDNFYQTDAIREIKLTIKQDNWRGALDSLRKNGENFLVAKATIDGVEYENVGVKYRGSRSFKIGTKRNPLEIKLNFIDKNQAHQGYQTVKLSDALRDPSMIREILGYEIARKYMPAPQANFAQVYVNNDYYGFFVNVEEINDQFLTKHFGDSDGSFFKGIANQKASSTAGCKKNVFSALIYEEDAACYLKNYELKSESGWDDLIQLTRILERQPNRVDRVLNVDRTLWMLAFNNVLVNLNSYSGRQSQNFYLYQDSTGHFNPIIGDLNLAFGSYKSAIVGSDLRLKQLQELDPLLHVDGEYKPLIRQLLQDPVQKKIYLSHVRTILNENFVNGTYLDRAETLQRMIQVPFINDPNRKYSFDEFKKSLKSTIGQRSRIPGIKELMQKRTKILRKSSALRAIPPSITEVSPHKRGQYESTAINDFTIQASVDKLPQKVVLVYRYNDKDTFKKVEMLDDGKNNDVAAKDGIFTAKVSADAGTHLEYYIIAESKAAINFAPSNYMHKLYEVNISELN